MVLKGQLEKIEGVKTEIAARYRTIRNKVYL